MRNNINVLFAVLVFFIFSCQDRKRNLYPLDLEGSLELMTPDHTGVYFNNAIKEDEKFNQYYYSQIYVGSGVALGDINNDGLPDIFLGGNQVKDKLFLNKGDFKFEDISEIANVSITNGWTWGVTMADVNADGYLDIYVSRNGNSLDPKDRRNQLYINNQDLTFTESAISYGLADSGFSTQAVFFDYDNDGDLDMYQVNQPVDRKVSLISKSSREDLAYYLDRLYRNDNGKFIDVSKEVGISRQMAYGLSVNASDFNNDGWVDLYVANDYAEPDFMYYNNGDGTFKDVTHEQLKHITQLSMGSDTGDINNDGLLDLITTDMTPEDHYRSKTNMASMSTENFRRLVNAGAHYQYMANALQVNTGLGHFSDVANLAGIAYTDWSWASLLVDLDNDGWKDIIVSNGIKKDVDNNDYLIRLQNLDPKTTTPEELFEFSQKAPSQPISNYAFRNKGNLEFEKVTTQWGFDTPSFSNGMAYGDLDNDGDLDIVTNNMESEAFIYRNNTKGNFLKVKFEGSEKNTFGLGAKAIIFYDNRMQIGENTFTRGFISSVEPGVFFGLGKELSIDSLKVIWPDGRVSLFDDLEANEVITAKYSSSEKKNKIVSEDASVLMRQVTNDQMGLVYKHNENDYDDFQKEILLPHSMSQNGPFITTGDVNGDQLEDFYVGGAVGSAGQLYIQNISGKFELATLQPWVIDKASEDLGCILFDFDNDNDLDLYVASGGNEYLQGSSLLQDRIYINDGLGNYSKAINILPEINESSQCVKASDIDNDGDIDLFVGTRLIPGKYSFPATSYLLINENGKYVRAPNNVAPKLDHLGMVTDAVFADVDNDNDEDLMIVGEWMEITLLLNEQGTFTDASSLYNLNNTRGLWWSLTANDIDNDGDIDFVLGNLGKNNKFKASEEHPFKVYANDFDNNGTNDIVLAKFYKDDYVPVRGRECTSQQMPYIADKFKDFHSFASSKLMDILPEETIEDAVVYEIKSFESIILFNEDGNFVKKKLPIQSQISPIKSILIDDFNNDGIKDIVIAGNHYGVEVETTRYDAGFGAVLLGNENNNYDYIGPNKSGFYVPYDSRDIKMINLGDKEIVLVANNNDSISVFNKNLK